jgi:hypothetical protein
LHLFEWMRGSNHGHCSLVSRHRNTGRENSGKGRCDVGGPLSRIAGIQNHKDFVGLAIAMTAPSAPASIAVKDESFNLGDVRQAR